MKLPRKLHECATFGLLLGRVIEIIGFYCNRPIPIAFCGLLVNRGVIGMIMVVVLNDVSLIGRYASFWTVFRSLLCLVLVFRRNYGDFHRYDAIAIIIDHIKELNERKMCFCDARYVFSYIKFETLPEKLSFPLLFGGVSYVEALYY